VHLRRALLLFAIVIGLAAVAASVSRPREAAREQPRGAPSATTQPAEPTIGPGVDSKPLATLSFDAERRQTRRLEAGRPATVEVAVDEPGQVEIPLLGLSSSAEPLTPARFDLLASEPRRYAITFTPAAGDEARVAGTLVVREAER
jgi:hypothetical protein